MSIKSLFKKTFLYRVYLKVRYHSYELRNKKRNIAFHEEASDVLQKFCDALNESSIVFWLEFGTLLGYYRDRDFIPHDSDLDTGAFLVDAERIRLALQKHGFERIRYYNVVGDIGLEECYKHSDFQTTIDIFYFRPDGNVNYCNSFIPLLAINKRKNIGKEIPCQVKKIEVPNCGYIESQFKGNKVFVPADCESYLKAHYGESFMIPNPNFDSRKDSLNITWYSYSEKKGICVVNQA